MSESPRTAIRAKLHYLRSDGDDGLEAVMALPDGNLVVAPLEANWVHTYGPMLLEWMIRKLRALKP